MDERLIFCCHTFLSTLLDLSECKWLEKAESEFGAADAHRTDSIGLNY